VRVVCQWIDRLRNAARSQGHSVALVVDPVLAPVPRTGSGGQHCRR
jgi:hypothetical protein